MKSACNRILPLVLLCLVFSCQRKQESRPESYLQTFDGPSEEGRRGLEQVRELYGKFKFPELDGLPVFRQMLDAAPVELPEDVTTALAGATGRSTEWVWHRRSHPRRVVMYLHGGAYVLGSPKIRRSMAARISTECKVRVLTVGYRLAPEHPFPAAVEDALAGYRFLLTKGFKPENIVLAGDSAGSGLALAALLSIRDAEDLELPAGAVLLSPWTDLAMTGAYWNTDKAVLLNEEWCRKMAKAYAGKTDLKHPLVSPLYADLKGLPPLLIQAGTNEAILDDSTRLAKRAHRAGIRVKLQVYKGMWHVFQGFGAKLPESRTALREMDKFLQSIFP
jgi:acetyl esterase/lipase